VYERMLQPLAPDITDFRYERPFDAEENAAALIAVRLELDGVVEEYHATQSAHVKYAKRGDLAVTVQRGKEIAARLKVDDLAEEISKLEQEKGAVGARLAEVQKENRRLSGSRPFDGRCPVMRDTCPVGLDVSARCASDVALHEAVSVEFEATSGRYANLSDKLSRLSVRQQDREQNARQLEGLRAKRDALIAEGVSLTMQAPPGLDVISSKKHALARRERDLLEARIAHARDLETTRKAEIGMREIDAVIEKARAEIEVLQAVAQVFGRNGAQKVAAKSILSEIEGGANDAIAECGIDLSVELTWGEQGEGLAKECSKCGAAFPTSAKVKECARCGNERGANMMQRLDVRLSERSGAAEDIAGMAVQLAASGWLRRTRGATWDTAMIDEPFAQLDAYHRKSLAKHFSSMLSGRYGFRQAIVIAHHPEVTFAFPGRIEIEWANDCASLRVVE
jgi:DNA repair exonuclease SbcCD ATPase subunit